MAITPPELILIGHGNAVTALAFSADGKTLVSGSYDQTAIVWDVEAGQMKRHLQLREFVDSLILTPDRTWLVTDDGHVWDVHTGRLLRKVRGYMAPLACSPDGRTLARATYLPNTDGAHILLTDVRTGRLRHRFPCSEHQPDSLAFSSDGQWIAACGWHSRQEAQEGISVTTVYHLKTKEIRQVLPGHNVLLFGVNLGADARLIAVARDGSQLWNAETGEVLKMVVKPSSKGSMFDTLSVCLSPDGNLLAVGTPEGEVNVWNVTTSARLWQAPAHHGWLRAIAITNDGRTLATAGDDHTIVLWDAWKGTRRGVLGRRRTAVEAVGFSTDGQGMTAIHEDGMARLWRMTPPMRERQESDLTGVLAYGAPHKPDTARNLWSIPTLTLAEDVGLPIEVTIAAISPDGCLLALNRRDGDVTIWNRIERRLQCTVPIAPEEWDAPTFSPDSHCLVFCYHMSKRMRLFDVQTGDIRWDVAVDEEEALGASEFCFSVDNRLLAAGDTGFAVTLWNVKSGKRKRLLWAHRDGVSALAFSPDASVLAIGTAYEETVWLRSLTRGRKDVALVGHTDDICSADFSPNGQVIATGAQDGTVRLWEAESGKLLSTFLALPDDEWIIFTPDGHYSGSPGAERYILWKSGDDLFPADALTRCPGPRESHRC